MFAFQVQINAKRTEFKAGQWDKENDKMKKKLERTSINIIKYKYT